MKKIFAVMLAMVTLFLLVACDNTFSDELSLTQMAENLKNAGYELTSNGIEDIEIDENKNYAYGTILYFQPSRYFQIETDVDLIAFEFIKEENAKEFFDFVTVSAEQGRSKKLKGNIVIFGTNELVDIALGNG